jgi:multiple sugar transport system ATP-binding protein
MNLMPTTVLATGPAGVTVSLPGGAPVLVPVSAAGLTAGEALTLGLRPEHLGIGEAVGGPGEAFLPASAKMVEHLGGEILAHVVLPDGTALNVKTHGHGEVTRSSDIQLGVRGELAYLFTAAGDCLPSLHPRDLPQ